MKRLVPMLLATFTGCVVVAAFFIPPAKPVSDAIADWYTILAAFAIILGASNLFFHHLSKISDQRRGWAYSVVTLVGFVVAVTCGLLKVGVSPAAEYPTYRWSGMYTEEGSAAWWLFEYVVTPATSTMFALLAFYVASAAFRAFRAKSVEAMLLLGTALVVLLGRSYAGTVLSAPLPPALSFASVTDYVIMSVFNTAGQRAIMIGIALGVAATSLRILLGMDRSYLGAED